MEGPAGPSSGVQSQFAHLRALVRRWGRRGRRVRPCRPREPLRGAELPVFSSVRPVIVVRSVPTAVIALGSPMKLIAARGDRSAVPRSC
jgi:hypothetical protein